MEKLFWSRRDEKILISIFVFCHRLISRRNFSFLLVEGNDIQSDFSLPAHIQIPHTYFSGSVMVLFSVITVMAITWFIPGVPSSYTAPYTYSTGSSKSCSGADVDDPDLGTNIRICYPEGNYEYNNTIYVEKRSNLLGAVVTYARTTPSRF